MTIQDFRELLIARIWPALSAIPLIRANAPTRTTAGAPVPAGAAASRPAKPYATYKILAPPTSFFQTSDHSYDVATETLEHWDLHRITVSFQIFGDPDTDNAEEPHNIDRKLSLLSTRDLLKSVGIGYLSTLNLGSIDAGMETFFEPRGNIDVAFSLSERYTESIPTIQGLELQTTITGPTGAVEIDRTDAIQVEE